MANEKIANMSALKALAEKLKETVPSNISQLANDAGYQTEAQVAAQVAAADHLTRKKVTSLEDIDPAAGGAEKYIYMVPSASAEDGNQYDEYMVLDGALEYMGSTRADLSGYVRAEEGKGLSANDFTNEDKAKLDSIEIATDGEIAAMLAEVFGT